MGPLEPLGLRDALFLHAVLHIVEDGPPREQGELLEDDAAVRARAGHRLSVDMDGSPLMLEEAANEIEQRRLSAARRAEQRHERTALDGERHVGQRENVVSVRRLVAVGESVDGNSRGFHQGAFQQRYCPRKQFSQATYLISRRLYSWQPVQAAIRARASVAASAIVVNTAPCATRNSTKSSSASMR